jgi:polysaccharide chain length determinant protein (PEP-CTERM system associated)
MNEILAQIYGFARAAWRRRWTVVTTAWVVALLGWAVVLTMPDRYEASARVFVDARTPLRPVLQGIAIEQDYESQISLVREALLSRPQLETVVRQTNLDAGMAATPAGHEALIAQLQRQIQVVATAPSRSGSDAIYTISYQHGDRAKSIEVVRTLVDNFVEGTLSGNRSGATEAQNFLIEQIGELEKRLQEAEQRLADFKKSNIGLIPGERGDYFARRDQQTAGLQQAETNLAVALSRQAELRRQLTSSQAYLPGTTGGGATGAPPDVTLRRQQAEQQLEELLLRFTDRHPDVIQLRRTIDELKERETKELAELQKGGAGTGAIRSLAANPVYQQVQTQLSQVQVEIASYQGAIRQHQAEIANLGKYVDQAPEVEQEFAQLNRDYTVTKAQYEQLVARREQVRVSDDAASTGIMRFDVIEPPHAALEPVSPKRQLLIVGVLVVALGAGLGLAILPYLLMPTFDSITELGRRLGVPVIGAVSAVRTVAQRTADHRQLRWVALAGGALVAATGLLVVAGGTGARLLQQLLA